MATSAEAARAAFEEFELEMSSGELIRNGRRIRLQTQPFLLLKVLLERAGAVVTREELHKQLWPDKSYGDFDHGLNKAMAKLRDALGDSSLAGRLIETLPRRGYRFTGTVRWIAAEERIPAKPVGPSKAVRALKLRWIVAGVAVLALMAAGLWVAQDRMQARRAQMARIESVAVLPFANLSQDPEQEYFADGITDELVTDLSHVRSLRVMSRTSTLGLKNTRLSIPEIAATLHVDGVIEGSVERSGTRVRVRARLVGAYPERELWSANYESDVSDLLRLQSRIAADAAGGIRAQITPAERAGLIVSSPRNPEAHDEYLRGRYLLSRETGHLDKAIPHLERAIALEPEFAAAYAALGEAWALEGVWGDESNREVSGTALKYSERAVMLDPNSAEAYASLGHSLMQCRQWNKGEAALRRAIELDPDNTQAVEYLAILLAQKGRVAEGLQISREIAVANPIAVDIQTNYANLLYRARRYDETIAQCFAALELDPNHHATYSTLANALTERGRFEEAREAFKKGRFLDAGVDAWLEAKGGNFRTARGKLAEAPKLVNVHTAVARYIMGQREEGLAELDYLANEKWAVKTYHLRNDPTFDPMRGDPGFDQIVKRTGVLDQ